MTKIYTYKYPFKDKIWLILYILLEAILIYGFFQPFNGLLVKIAIVIIFIVILVVIGLFIMWWVNSLHCREVELTQDHILLPFVTKDGRIGVDYKDIIKVEEDNIGRSQFIHIIGDDFDFKIVKSWMRNRDYYSLLEELKDRVRLFG